MNENMNAGTSFASDLKDRYLLFNIDDTKYGVSLEYVLEIINVQTITQVPGVAHYIKGIINLRGKIIPIIDVRLKLGLPEREYDDKTCIIVLNVNEVQVGVIVDRVSEVVNAENSQLSVPSEVGEATSRYLSSILELEDKIVLIIDCEKFFSSELDYGQF
ncbi:MAG TPA: purine-binding chemotaxis protein CheW [Clostridiales bacterium]|jgi:purine-binding chemotaxis protein CheW|nr:purine-binding chemotaxis protein CheW [Clostridiales bacterium]